MIADGERIALDLRKRKKLGIVEPMLDIEGAVDRCTASICIGINESYRHSAGVQRSG